MTDQPVPIRTEYVGVVDDAHVWRVWRTDTDEAIGWNVSPIDPEPETEDR